MKIYYITPSEPLADEGTLLSTMLGMGVERVHLRHPACSEAELSDILSSIAPDFRSRVVLHDCHQLALRYGCTIHLNRRHPVPPDDYAGPLSCSCHSLDEVEAARVDYCTLSPIFDSISKPGYTAASFDRLRLHSLLVDRNIVALGGITPDRFNDLRDMGFASVALSGYITGDGVSAHIIERLKKCFNS